MAEYKYPYIPKEYYPAVMFACKLIRQNGQFHRAINSASKYYGVNAEELEKHVRARQGAGQKGKTRSTYKYYAVQFDVAPDIYTDYDPLLKGNRIEVLKATSEKNAKNHLHDKYDDRRYYEGSSFVYIKRIEEFATKNEANEKAREWHEERWGE